MAYPTTTGSLDGPHSRLLKDAIDCTVAELGADKAMEMVHKLTRVLEIDGNVKECTADDVVFSTSRGLVVYTPEAAREAGVARYEDSWSVWKLRVIPSSHVPRIQWRAVSAELSGNDWKPVAPRRKNNKRQ